MKANIRCAEEKMKSPASRQGLSDLSSKLSGSAGFAGHLGAGHPAAAGRASAVHRPAGRLAADHLAAGRASGSDFGSFTFLSSFGLKRAISISRAHGE